MLEILSITSVVFALILIGYCCVHFGMFGSGETRILGKYVVQLALPALIFDAVSSRPVAEIADMGYLLAVLTGSLAVFAFGYFSFKFGSATTPIRSVFGSMGMSCSNSGFMGYPVLLIALPEVAQTALAMNMIIENLVMIPMVLILSELARNETKLEAGVVMKIFTKLARNPILIALVLGFLVSVFSLDLPQFIRQPVSILAMSSAAVSLLVIGGTLASMPITTFNSSVILIVLGKLVLHPLAVGCALAIVSFWGFGVVNEDLAAAAIIMAAMPVMSIYPILAQEHGEEQMAALAMFVMTIVSFFTISLVLAILLP